MIERALVLEDDRFMRAMLAILLRENGYLHSAHASPQQAHFELSNLPYAIALVDVQLGEADGIEFIRALRRTPAINRKIPVLVISGQNRREVIEGARDAGADGFLTKPASVKDILAKIGGVRARRRPFIEATTYVGPDRRYRAYSSYAGSERRAEGNGTVYV